MVLGAEREIVTRACTFAAGLAPAHPDTAGADLFASLEQRCRYCRSLLVPLIDTDLGVVWACGSAAHAWPLVFWGGAGGEEGLRNVAWIVRALLERAGPTDGRTT